MSVLVLRDVKKDFGIKEILKSANFSLEPAERVGLIGTNGSGKSTLLKAIAGLEPIDGGEIQTGSGTRAIYLPQEPPIDPELTVLEQVLADSREAAALLLEYEQLSEQLATEPESDRLLARLAAVNQKLDALNAWELETKAKIALDRLGVKNLQAKVGDLSGGQRKRVALAAALVSEPDVLLMDEPTNHLDADAVEWLQEYLANVFRGALLLVTHDRYFLDLVAQRILEIDRGDLFTYEGSYSYYLEKKAAQEESEASSQRKHVGVLRRELAWLQRGPKARSTKQKARIDRIGEMQEREFREARGKVDISAASQRLGKKVIDLKNIGKSYSDRAIISDFTFTFEPGDRVGIIGGNGVGKSTFLEIATGRLEPDRGIVEIGSTVAIGYFDQHSRDLEARSEDQRVLDYLKEVGAFVKLADGTQISASQMLERFLFTGNQQYIPLHKLSGGERRRLFLLKLLMGAPNVLILDEPTNDLDVQTLSVLEEYLEEFAGCVITVSHDRYFLDRIATSILAFPGNGEIQSYPGNYTTYLEYKRARDARQAEAEAIPKAAPTKPPEPAAPAAKKSKQDRSSRRLSNWERREFEELETKVPALEAKKADLEAQMAQLPPADYERLQQFLADLEALDAEIETATERWLELAERAD